MYLSYPCSKAQVPAIPLPSRWSQLHHHIISLKCFTGKQSQRLCNLISINHQEKKDKAATAAHTWKANLQNAFTGQVCFYLL